MFFFSESIFTALASPALVPVAEIVFYMLQTMYLGHAGDPEPTVKCLGTSEGRTGRYIA